MRSEPIDVDGFREFLTERDLPGEQIEIGVATAARFAAFAAVYLGRGSTDLVHAFAAVLIEAGDTTWDHFAAIARYGHFLGDEEIYLTAVDLVDGAEAMDNLYDRVGQELGEDVRDLVFAGIDLPPLGTAAIDRPLVAAAVMERLEAIVDAETCRRLLDPSLRNLPDEWYLEERGKYREVERFDTYLQRKGDEFLSYLEDLAESGDLYFTQKVTPEVVEFVRANPEISHGVRDGTTLYETKIPYDTIGYLAAENDEERRYRYCHCPWVRESLKGGEVAVSPTFCRCSAGFHKKQWEVILDRPLEAEIVESVLAGEDRCRIAIHLPEEVVGGAPT